MTKVAAQNFVWSLVHGPCAAALCDPATECVERSIERDEVGRQVARLPCTETACHTLYSISAKLGVQPWPVDEQAGQSHLSSYVGFGSKTTTWNKLRISRSRAPPEAAPGSPKDFFQGAAYVQKGAPTPPNSTNPQGPKSTPCSMSAWHHLRSVVACQISAGAVFDFDDSGSPPMSSMAKQPCSFETEVAGPRALQ